MGSVGAGRPAAGRPAAVVRFYNLCVPSGYTVKPRVYPLGTLSSAVVPYGPLMSAKVRLPQLPKAYHSVQYIHPVSQCDTVGVPCHLGTITNVTVEKRMLFIYWIIQRTTAYHTNFHTVEHGAELCPIGTQNKYHY